MVSERERKSNTSKETISPFLMYKYVVTILSYLNFPSIGIFCSLYNLILTISVTSIFWQQALTATTKCRLFKNNYIW